MEKQDRVMTSTERSELIDWLDKYQRTCMFKKTVASKILMVRDAEFLRRHVAAECHLKKLWNGSIAAEKIRKRNFRRTCR